MTKAGVNVSVIYSHFWLSLWHWKIVTFLDIQLQNSLFHSEFVDVLKCNQPEQHMYLSLLMYIGQQTDVNFVVHWR